MITKAPNKFEEFITGAGGDIFFLVPLGFALVDILMMDVQIDLLQLGGVLVLFFSVRSKARLYGALTLIFLALAPIGLVTGKFGVAEKAAIWVFYLVCLRVAQLIFRYRG